MLLGLWSGFWEWGGTPTPPPAPDPNGCHVLLQSGFKIIKESGDGFLLLTNCAIGTEDDSGGIPYVRYANVEYALAKERERIKQEEIIRLRLEAQELLMRERELADKRDKQSRRQLAALEKEKASLMADIQYQLVALDKLQKITVQRKNRVIMLLLTAACPFNNLTIANNKRMI